MTPLRSKRRSRSEILNIVTAMADELEGRADEVGRELRRPGVGEADSYRRAALALREVLSIAHGRKSPAYWQRPRASRGCP